MNILETSKNVYFIGIKGAGMTAIAEFLHARCKDISGSDTEERFFTDEILTHMGVRVKTGFKKENITDETDLVIFSTAYDKTNPEIVYARENKIQLLSYPEALGMLIELFPESVAVSGTHGKTTITALLGWVLERGGKDPSVIIGARSNNWHSNARAGKGKIFVFEADEYQDKFKYYKPTTIILNNIDYDHPDFFKDMHQYRETFISFIKNISPKGILYANYDNLETRNILKNSEAHIVWYGENKFADWELISRRALDDGSQSIKIAFNDSVYGEFKIPLIGKHNALNCLPVVALSHKHAIPIDTLKEAFSSFQGTVRRLEVIGWHKDILIIDDYAHHPTEIRASLNAVRESYPNRRIVCVFQPHTFSRTEALLDDFANT